MEVNSKILKHEHELIERELIELDTIVHSSIINYPNLVHVLKKLKEIWDKHEEKEHPFFMDLYKKGFTIPMDKISFEHGKLKRDFDRLMEITKTGKEDSIHDALYKNGKDLINNLRKHMTDEDWILYALPKKYKGE